MSVPRPARIVNCGLAGIEPVPVGMHACHFYSSREELVAALVPFFVAGLNENQRCIWITAQPLSAIEAIEALRAAWPAVEHAMDSGRLRILDFDKWYANSGQLKGIELLESWLAEEERALADGYDGLRITGNMSFLRPGDWSAFLRYERAVSEGFRGRRIVALCSYALEQCDEERMVDVKHVHHSAVERSGASWQMVPTSKTATARRELNGRAHRGRSDFRLLLDAVAAGFCAIDRDGSITMCNDLFLRMTGYLRKDEVIGRNIRGLIRNSNTEGLPDAESHHPALEVAQTGSHVHSENADFYRADATRFPVEYWARPISDGGRIEGAVCTILDIAERKRAEAQQQLVNRELAHRVKNTLTVVQAIVSQTLRSTADPNEAVKAVNARLIALRDADDMLMASQRDGAALFDVIGRGLAVYGVDNPRIQVAGPRLIVGPKTAVALTMILHELCTNAVKHGALSNDNGKVELIWSADGGVADPKLHLRWNERGGPPVTPPVRKGFGSQIIQQYCKSMLRAEFALAFKAEGLEWTLDTPLEAIKQ